VDPFFAGVTTNPFLSIIDLLFFPVDLLTKEAKLAFPECDCALLTEKAFLAFEFLPKFIVFSTGTVTEIVTTLS
jgi:hypothetical protein